MKEQVMPSHRQPSGEAQRKPSNANLGQKEAKREKMSESKLGHMQGEELEDSNERDRSQADPKPSRRA
jgi:hypothetical protein